MTELTLKLEKTIHAPIDKVFDAWLDPAMLTQFVLPQPGMPQPEVENDPREGGQFKIIMRHGDDVSRGPGALCLFGPSRHTQ